MGSVQNFYTSRDNNTDPATYVGQLDRLWYNPTTNSIFVSDGTTPGGVPVALATGANITANNVSLNTITARSGTITITGNIDLTGYANIAGNISPAAPNKVGGIQPGPGVVIANDGTLTIDTANLPLSFGNFTANNNVLSIVNVDEDMILQTEGSAEIQLVGNIGFYKPDGIPPNVANRYAFFNNDGQATFYIPVTDPLEGAFKIIGSASGSFSPPLNTGVMLQLTGQNNDASRFYNDSIGSFAAFVGRRINGNVANPTAVLAGEELIRISSTGYNGTTIPGDASARIVFQAQENYTPTARGSNLSFWSTAIGSNVLTKIATVDVANGFNATKFTTSGTVSATGNIDSGNINTGNISLTGNVIGNIITGGTISATGNITGGNILTTGLISATGNVAAGNVNAYVTLPAGTATKAPLVYTAGTILTAPVAGATNYDGTVFYATPSGSQRGLIRTAQTYVPNTDYTLLNQSTIQSMFGVAATVSSNTRYGYSIYAIVYKSANNITMSFALDGNAVLARHTWQSTTSASATLATLSTPSLLKNAVTSAFDTPTVITAALNGTGFYSVQITGQINVTTGGTWNPLVSFSGLPGVGSYLAAGSSVEIWPLGAATGNVNIGTWA